MAHLRGRERARYVTRMFARISRRYDLLNTVMTAGRHHAWRRMATKMAVEGLEGTALDVGTGTGDFALELACQPKISQVVGLDFTREMLGLAEGKARRRGVASELALLVGDAHDLPFQTERFACATVGFGIRNFVDVPRALREMTRVLMPGGWAVVLEIVRAERTNPVGMLFYGCFRFLTPWLGALLAGDREAYTYLPESVGDFRSASELAALMEDAGLRDVTFHELALGTVAIHVGRKE